MLGDVTKIKTMSAAIYTPDESNAQVIVYLVANLTDDGNCTITKSIRDKALYEKYQEDVTADYAKFESLVMEESE